MADDEGADSGGGDAIGKGGKSKKDIKRQRIAIALGAVGVILTVLLFRKSSGSSTSASQAAQQAAAAQAAQDQSALQQAQSAAAQAQNQAASMEAGGSTTSTGTTLSQELSDLATIQGLELQFAQGTTASTTSTATGASSTGGSGSGALAAAQSFVNSTVAQATSVGSSGQTIQQGAVVANPGTASTAAGYSQPTSAAAINTSEPIFEESVTGNIFQVTPGEKTPPGTILNATGGPEILQKA
jgi:hypothetical protein